MKISHMSKDCAIQYRDAVREDYKKGLMPTKEFYWAMCFYRERIRYENLLQVRLYSWAYTMYRRSLFYKFYYRIKTYVYNRKGIYEF